ncbi:MAG: ABC transporter permease [Methanosarcinaceae archaeon]|nr:ABC transporter permease [Methanosarcinaceae archaeon]
MFEVDIAFRHIRSRRRQTMFSVMAVALAVAIIIISMSMMSGFMKTIIDVTVENQPHITVSPKEGEDYIYLYHGFEDYVLGQEGVVAVSSYYEGEAALQYRHNVEGAMLLGVNPEDEDRLMNVTGDMVAGDFNSLTGSGSRIILGSKLARNLDVDIGDTVTAKFPGSDPTDFKITGIFQTGTPVDETLAYANLRRVQDFYGQSDIITGMDIRLSDIYEAENHAEVIDRETGYDATSWMELNSEILNLIATQEQFVYIFYVMIFAISGFGIANTLIMIVMEKVAEIGILLAMGTSRRSILFIFLLEAGILGLAGVIIGSVLGYISDIVLLSYSIPVPPDIYFGMDHLPLLIVPKNFIIAGLFAMAINMIAGLFPARRASKMDPVEAIHSV